MKRIVEPRPIISIMLLGLTCGILFAAGMALWDYFDNEPFHLMQFLFYTIFFGFFMGLSFRYKITK